jgi:hypothetical protein
MQLEKDGALLQHLTIVGVPIVERATAIVLSVRHEHPPSLAQKFVIHNLRMTTCASIRTVS